MAGNKLHSCRSLAGPGFVKPEPPRPGPAHAARAQRWGPTPAAGFAASAMRYPHETSIIDELGTLTFDEVNRRTNALANALSDDGIVEGDNVA